MLPGTEADFRIFAKYYAPGHRSGFPNFCKVLPLFQTIRLSNLSDSCPNSYEHRDVLVTHLVTSQDKVRNARKSYI